MSRAPRAGLRGGGGGGGSGPAPSIVKYTLTGVVSVAAGVERVRFPSAGTVVAVSASINTAPTGASLIVDVNKNGTTIFTTQANRPTIAASANASGNAIPDVIAIAAGDYLTVDVDQVGSSVAGSNLVVEVLVLIATAGGSVPTTPAGGVLSGTYPNPTFAVDMATQAELDAVAAAKANTSHTHVAAALTPGTPGAGKYFDGASGWTVLPSVSGSGAILPWATGTAYVQGQPVTNSGHAYTANDAHTSGATFAGDLGAHWTLLPVTKGDVGLGNVDNTSDVGKPVSTAQQTALDAKLDDSQLDVDGTLAANSDTRIASQKATKTYVDANAGGDASAVDVSPPVAGGSNVQDALTGLEGAVADVSAGVLPGGAGLYVSIDQPTDPFLPSIWIPLDNAYAPMGGSEWPSHVQFFTGPPVVAGSPEAVVGSTDSLGWWDAPAIAGLAGSDPISVVNDVMSGGINLLGSGASRPTYEEGVQNGKPVMRFSKATPSLLRTSNYPVNFSPTVPQPLEIWIAFVLRTLTTNGILAISSNGQTGVSFNTGPTIDLLGGSNHYLADNPYMTTFHTWRFVLDDTSSSITCDRTLLSASGAPGASGFLDWLNIGSINGGSGADLDLGTMYVSRRGLTSGEADDMWDFFQGVWGTVAP